MKSIAALILCLFSAAAQAQIPAPKPQAFAEQAPPPAPDYASPAAWAAGIDDPGASRAVPAGATPAATRAKVDVFYIHPTTYLSNERWNQDIADKAANAWVDASVVARQASVFNACCRVFAPRYRQGSHLALSHFAGEGQQALALAYGDVERAFDYYIAHYNKGRPFILVGHSQGSLHLMKLLQRRIDGSPLQTQMVAAYVVGMTLLSEGDFGRAYKTIPICDTPAQTGCVVGWNSVLPTADIAKAVAVPEQGYAQRYGGEQAGKTVLCVNPLTFDRARPAAGAAQSKGAVPGDPGAGPVRALVPHAVAAHCDRGLLVVEPDPALGLKPLPGDAMHYHDLGLFYEDVRENAVLRATSFVAAHPRG